MGWGFKKGSEGSLSCLSHSESWMSGEAARVGSLLYSVLSMQVVMGEILHRPLRGPQDTNATLASTAILLKLQESK